MDKRDLQSLGDDDLINLGRWAVAELERKDILPDSVLGECIAIEREFTRRGAIWQRAWKAIVRGDM